MAEYSVQPNFMHSRFEAVVGAAKFSVMPKSRGPHKLKTGPKPISKLPFLKKRRIAKGWNVADLADRSGLSTGTVSGIENGTQGYSDDSLHKLADAFGISPGTLKDVDPDRPMRVMPLLPLWEQATEGQRELILKLVADVVNSGKSKD